MVALCCLAHGLQELLLLRVAHFVQGNSGGRTLARGGAPVLLGAVGPASCFVVCSVVCRLYASPRAEGGLGALGGVSRHFLCLPSHLSIRAMATAYAYGLLHVLFIGYISLFPVRFRPTHWTTGLHIPPKMLSTCVLRTAILRVRQQWQRRLQQSGCWCRVARAKATSRFYLCLVVLLAHSYTCGREILGPSATVQGIPQYRCHQRRFCSNSFGVLRKIFVVRCRCSLCESSRRSRELKVKYTRYSIFERWIS